MNTQTIYLHHSWKFHYGEEPDAWKKDYDDTGWTAVELPHDWSVAMPFSRSYSSGTGYAAAASDGIVEPFPCLRSIVENASCCCLTVSTKKARSGSTVIITAFIPMDTHLFSMT